MKQGNCRCNGTIHYCGAPGCIHDRVQEQIATDEKRQDRWTCLVAWIGNRLGRW